MLVADVDFDKKNEIVIGTYGQQVLIYKEFEHEQNEGGVVNPSEWKLCHKESFEKPIMSLHWADVTQDGFDNLIVVTAMGVHILKVT